MPAASERVLVTTLFSCLHGTPGKSQPARKGFRTTFVPTEYGGRQVTGRSLKPLPRLELWNR
jgi:hypothetical protein